MTISTKIILDSTSPENIRLTTFQLRYPRFIHSSFMTHRVFSRNASSSRAIPVEKLIDDVISDPVYPSYWGKNKSGMQANEELDTVERYLAAKIWKSAREDAIQHAQELVNLNAHKQIVNRLLEPFSHINVIATATDLNNFFELRRHKDAQPEFKILADKMFEELEHSTPKALNYSQWHIPYLTKNDKELPFSIKMKISTARCARVSYLTHEGKEPSIEADLKLYDRLVGSKPLHASPSEHIARADTRDANSKKWSNPTFQGNFYGWIQFRKLLEYPDPSIVRNVLGNESYE